HYENLGHWEPPSYSSSAIAEQSVDRLTARMTRHAARSEHHHGSANDVARSEQIEGLVDVSKFEGLDGVTNLLLGGKRHDLTEVRVVAPKRAMKGLFAGYAGEERYIDAIADQAHVGIVTADREQAEGQLHHLRSARAVHDGVQVFLAHGLVQLR